MIQLSASSIKDFISCEMKYYYRINAPEQAAETVELVRGKLIHEILEKGWRDRNSANKIASGLRISNTNMDKIILWMDKFFENFRPLCKDTDNVEQFFKLPYEGIKIVGKIDRILDADVVIDWKSSASKPRNLENDIQFILYDWAYTRMFGKRPSVMFIGHLPTGSLIKYEENPIFRKLLFDEIIPTMIGKIQSKSYAHTGIFQWVKQCDRCVFQEYCYKELEGL